jgi:hypothetical protein
MRSAILIAGILIGMAINPTLVFPDGFTKFCYWALMLMICADVYELVKK